MVVGTAVDGLTGVQRALELRPDVITMDVEMPRMDGVHAVREIMRTVPTPIVMLSTLTRAGAETTIQALEAGAVDCVAKPSGLSHELAGVEARLTQAIQRAKETRVLPRHTQLTPLPTLRSGRDDRGRVERPAKHVLIIGSSTGGPPALSTLIPRLPANLDAGIIVVQHMPAGFTDALARRLDSFSALRVSEAKDGDIVATGHVLVAPGDYHLEVTAERRVRIHQSATRHGVRPAIDLTLESVAPVYGQNTTVAILTGMGKDGAAGAAMIEQAGGKVFVQDEATCVVYGMPRVTRELTRRARELPIDKMADALAAVIGIAR